jgi:plastocyanin
VNPEAAAAVSPLMDRRSQVLPGLRPLFATLIVVVLALGLAACGDDDGGGTAASSTSAADTSGTDGYGTTTGGGAAAGTDGTIVAKDFSLTDLTVKPGDPIRLENQGGTTHTATADDGEFDLGRVGPGDTSDDGTAPDEPGSYAFHCEIHPSMTATLTVEG